MECHVIEYFLMKIPTLRLTLSLWKLGVRPKLHKCEACLLSFISTPSVLPPPMNIQVAVSLFLLPEIVFGLFNLMHWDWLINDKLVKHLHRLLLLALLPQHYCGCQSLTRIFNHSDVWLAPVVPLLSILHSLCDWRFPYSEIQSGQTWCTRAVLIDLYESVTCILNTIP